MKNKIGTVLLFFALAVVSIVVAVLFFIVYLDANKEIALAKKAPRTETPGMVSEYRGRVCWIYGTFKADDPGQLLLSGGTKRPCVYYAYTVEYADYDIDTDGDVDKTWRTATDVTEFAPIPLGVQHTKYRIRDENLIVRGGLEKTLDRIETRNHIEYRYSEYIIPDNTPAWVLGIPETDSIGPTKIGLIVTMNTPDQYIGGQATTIIVVVVIAVMLCCLSGLFTGLAVRIIRK